MAPPAGVPIRALRELEPPLELGHFGGRSRTEHGQRYALPLEYQPVRICERPRPMPLARHGVSAPDSGAYCRESSSPRERRMRIWRDTGANLAGELDSGCRLKATDGGPDAEARLARSHPSPCRPAGRRRCCLQRFPLEPFELRPFQDRHEPQERLPLEEEVLHVRAKLPRAHRAQREGEGQNRAPLPFSRSPGVRRGA